MQRIASIFNRLRALTPDLEQEIFVADCVIPVAPAVTRQPSEISEIPMSARTLRGWPRFSRFRYPLSRLTGMAIKGGKTHPRDSSVNTRVTPGCATSTECEGQGEGKRDVFIPHAYVCQSNKLMSL